MMPGSRVRRARKRARRFRCLGHPIYRDADKPNDLTLFMRYESRERADELMRDSSRAAAMQRGGVISEPRATWLEEADVASCASRRAA